MRIYLYAALGAVALAALAWFIHDQREIGAAKQAEKQRKTDEDFRKRSHQGGVDYDSCDRSGGLYDFRRGRCISP